MTAYTKADKFGKETTIAAEMLPGRKKPALTVRRGNTIIKYASFNNKYAAEAFMALLGDFIGFGGKGRG